MKKKKYYPKDIASMILGYLKNNADIYNSNNEIKQV